LKILKSLKILKKLIDGNKLVNSANEITTTTASKMLKPSRTNSLKPKAVSLNVKSTKNIQVNA